MERASGLFSCLTSKNRFRPKVLAQVSHNGKSFIGSSIRVSCFLRPRCLYNRIQRFKHNLKKAVTCSGPLCIADNEAMGWSSFAFVMKVTKTAEETGNRAEKSYTEPKPPCPNCQIMFKNLKGFIDCKNVSKDGDSYWGACAEYCPVDELLFVDDSKASSGADSEMLDKLKVHENQCSILFREFGDIAAECKNAYVSRDTERMEAIYPEVRSKIHIFGYKPQCKM